MSAYQDAAFDADYWHTRARQLSAQLQQAQADNERLRRAGRRLIKAVEAFDDPADPEQRDELLVALDDFHRHVQGVKV